MEQGAQSASSGPSEFQLKKVVRQLDFTGVAAPAPASMKTTTATSIGVATGSSCLDSLWFPKQLWGPGSKGYDFDAPIDEYDRLAGLTDGFDEAFGMFSRTENDNGNEDVNMNTSRGGKKFKRKELFLFE